MENEIVVVGIENVNGANVVNTRVVAEQLGKRHDNVLRDLEQICQTSNVGSDIILSSYKAGTGKSYKQYLLTEKGFTLYMFNIQGYNDFKMAYIDEFERLRNLVSKPKLPQTYKEALLELIRVEEEKEQLQTELEKTEKIVEHKTEVISTMVDDVKIQTQRQFLNEIIRMKGVNLIQNRWGVLYRAYETSNRINLKARMEGYNNVNTKKVTSKLAYIDEVRNDISGLYGLAVKIFESDFKHKLKQYLAVL